MASFLAEQVDGTREHVVSKYSKRPGELEAELEEDSELSSDSSDEEEVRMTKENYPVGWDGNPIPFWLYKVRRTTNYNYKPNFFSFMVLALNSNARFAVTCLIGDLVPMKNIFKNGDILTV